MTLKMSITRNQFSRNVSYKDKIPTYIIVHNVSVPKNNYDNNIIYIEIG
jgi:hypothetical protein